jgi:hypothetical protein
MLSDFDTHLVQTNKFNFSGSYAQHVLSISEVTIDEKFATTFVERLEEVYIQAKNYRKELV